MNEPEPTDAAVPSRAETGRVEAFSDGVLAVAITLLVLDLKIPHVAGDSLWHSLLKEWPAYVAYLTSFLIIGIIWMNHHSIFLKIRFVDRGIMLLNLLLLAITVAIPFGTTLVSAYLTEPGRNGNIAMAVYSGLSLAMAIAFSLLWGYALQRPHLLEPGVDVEASRKAFPRFAGGGIVYAVLIGVSLINAIVALIITLLLALYYAFEQLPGSRRV